MAACPGSRASRSGPKTSATCPISFSTWICGVPGAMICSPAPLEPIDSPMFASECTGFSDTEAMPALLQRIKAEVDDVRRVVMVQHAEDTALFFELVEHGQEMWRTECSAAEI